MKDNDMFGILFHGAPYGLDEMGEILSTHKTEIGAQRESRKLNSSPTYYGHIRIIELDDTCKYGCTYRDLIKRQNAR